MSRNKNVGLELKFKIQALVWIDCNMGQNIFFHEC